MREALAKKDDVIARLNRILEARQNSANIVQDGLIYSNVH